MYQTPVISATRLSRTAGPVCITRLAMRPAKSFWKNAQDCRATWKWFCQRIMLATLTAIAWLLTRFCAICASGRSSSSTTAMPSSIGQFSVHSVSGWLDVTRVTMRPMNTGMVESSSATIKPGDEQRGEQALGLAREVPIERDQAGRRLRLRRRLGRVEGFFEQAEHGGSNAPNDGS